MQTTEVGLEQVPGYNASALIKLDFTHADASCWFDLKPDTDGGQGSNSQQFSYVSEVGDSATFGLLSSASEATSTPTSTVSATTTTIETTSGTGDSQSTATRTNVLATTTATTSTSTAPGTTETASASLPVGAQAGIGVGAAVAGVAIAALAVFLFLRRRRQRTLSDEKAHPSGGEHWPPGVGNADVSSHYQPSEYGSSTVYSNTAPVVAPTSASDASKYVFPQSFPPPQAEGYGLPYNTVAQELDTPIHSVHELPTSRYT